MCVTRQGNSFPCHSIPAVCVLPGCVPSRKLILLLPVRFSNFHGGVFSAQGKTVSGVVPSAARQLW
jgi:hypothetical protein